VKNVSTRHDRHHWNTYLPNYVSWLSPSSQLALYKLCSL